MPRAIDGICWICPRCKKKNEVRECANCGSENSYREVNSRSSSKYKTYAVDSALLFPGEYDKNACRSKSIKCLECGISKRSFVCSCGTKIAVSKVKIIPPPSFLESFFNFLKS